MESRSRNVIKNIYWNYFNIFAGLILGFVSRTVFIRTLGVEYLGISGLFSNILSMLSLADLGFGTAMAYSYYAPIAENDEQKIASLNAFYRKIYIIIACLIAIIGVTLIPFLNRIINLDRTIDHIKVYYLLTLAGVVASYLMVYKSTLINAYQKNYLVSKYNTIISTCVTITNIIFMFITKNYIVYLIITLIGNLVNNIRISMVADKIFPFIKKKSNLEKEKKKEIFNNIKSVFLYKISSVLINGTDNILISSLVGTIFVGYYSNYTMIINRITSLITMFFTSMTASVGNIIVVENEKKKYKTFEVLRILSYWFSLVIVPCVYVLIDECIAIWLGTDFVLDKYTTLAITVNLYLICILQPIWIYREATGMYIKTKYIMLLTALLNIVFSIWWGKKFGIAGILFASAVSKICTYIWYEPILLFKDFFGKKAVRFFGDTLINIITAVVVGFILKYLVNIINIDGLFGFFTKSFAVFICSNIIYIILFCRNKSFFELINLIKNIIKRVVK